jgi:Papain family cysteine protease/Putative Ig domain
MRSFLSLLTVAVLCVFHSPAKSPFVPAEAKPIAPGVAQIVPLTVGQLPSPALAKYEEAMQSREKCEAYIVKLSSVNGPLDREESGLLAQAIAKAHPRGHKRPHKAILQQRYRASNDLKKKIGFKEPPPCNLPEYDSFADGITIPTGDQASCGNCHEWSAGKVTAAAQFKCGAVKLGTPFMISVQWQLDYHKELGGCDGGLEWDDAHAIAASGAPSAADYGGDGTGAGTPKSTTGMKLYQISSLIMIAKDENTIPDQQTMMNYIHEYGYVSIAAAAGSDWDSAGPGTIITGNSTDINHAIGYRGWKTINGKIVFILANQWGDSWGDKGTVLIAPGADSAGTDAFIAIAPGAPAPIPGPPTPGPAPVGLAPVITSPTTDTAQINVPYTFQIVGTNAPDIYVASPLPAGLTVSETTGLITGTPTTLGTTSIGLRAANSSGIGKATFTLTVSTVPAPPTPPVTPGFTGSKIENYIDGKIVGGSYGTPATDALVNDLKTAGVSSDVSAAIMTLISDLKAKASPMKTARDALKISDALLAPAKPQSKLPTPYAPMPRGEPDYKASIIRPWSISRW